MSVLFSVTAAASAPGVYYAFEHSDGVGKGIVVFLLLGSILTWTTLVDKVTSVFRAKRASDRFLECLHSISDKEVITPALIREIKTHTSPVGDIYQAGVEKLLEFYEQDGAGQNYGSHGLPAATKLSEAQYNAVEAVLEREVSSKIQELETRIGFLATLVSLSPFCGLFGTVWGVMMAFCGIAAAGKADFTALAPGVAGALLTTVAGLVVAIPSLVGYNILTSTIRQMTVIMDDFTEEFMVRVKLNQLEIRKSSAAPRESLLEK